MSRMNRVLDAGSVYKSADWTDFIGRNCKGVSDEQTHDVHDSTLPPAMTLGQDPDLTKSSNT